MRLLHLHWSHLLLRLARRDATTGSPDAPISGSFPSPAVLGGLPWEDAVVLDMDPTAAALGVRRGTSLGSAHRLAPEAAFIPVDRDRARGALEAALERLATLSPGVAGAVDPAAPSFGLLEVQLDGLERLWGDETRILARARTALGGVLPGDPRAGIAGTRFAARLAAAVAPPGGSHVVAPGEDAAFLAPLPAELLTDDRDVRARLARFGLRRIGAVGAIPRSALVARFGPEGERMGARARGEEVEPFVPHRALERVALHLPVEPPVAELEALRFVLHRLVGALAGQVAARGAATSRVRLRLELDLAFARAGTPGELAFEQPMPEPTADAEAIERLLLARLERDRPPAPVARLELELAGVGPAAGHQLSLFVPGADRAGRLAWQLARLALAFGDESVRRLELDDPDALLPERRARWTEATPRTMPAAGGGIDR